MKTKIFQFFFTSIFFVLALVPASSVYAANCENNPFPGAASNLTSQVPLFCSPSQLGNWAITILLSLAASVTIVFVIIGGYYYMTAAGNEEQSERGRKILTNSLIGLVVIIMSFAIVRIVVNTITGGTGSGQTINNNQPNNANNNAGSPPSNSNPAPTPQDIVMNMYNSNQLQVSLEQQAGAVNVTASFPFASLATLQTACGSSDISLAATLNKNNVSKVAPFTPTGKNYYASITFKASEVTTNPDTIAFAVCGVVFPNGGLPFTMPSQLQNVNQ